MPEGFKAQVVATSRQAAVTYQEKLEQARQQLVAELEALPPTLLTLPEDEIEQLDAPTRFLVRTYSELAKLRALEIAAVISFGDHNDPESWWDWADKHKQEERIQRFKRQFSWRRPTRQTRCPFWSSTTCSSPGSTRRWSKCCTSTGRSSRTICCKPSHG